MKVQSRKTGILWLGVGAAILLLAGCVTEQVSKKKSVAPVPGENIDPEVLQVQELVMKKALGGLRDMDQAALAESGWPAGIEEGKLIQANPVRYMNRGLRRDLIGNRYRVRYCLEKTVGPTTQTASAAPRAAAPATSQTQEGGAPALSLVTPPGGKIYILVTVPAVAAGGPLAQTDPYVFIVEKAGGRFQVTRSDFMPPDYMEGLDDPAILKKLMRDI